MFVFDDIKVNSNEPEVMTIKDLLNWREWGRVCSPACWWWPAAVYFQVNSGGTQPTRTPQPGRWADADRTASVETDAGKWRERERIVKAIVQRFSSGLRTDLAT